MEQHTSNDIFKDRPNQYTFNFTFGDDFKEVLQYVLLKYPKICGWLYAQHCSNGLSDFKVMIEPRFTSSSSPYSNIDFSSPDNRWLYDWLTTSDPTINPNPITLPPIDELVVDRDESVSATSASTKSDESARKKGYQWTNFTSIYGLNIKSDDTNDDTNKVTSSTIDDYEDDENLINDSKKTMPDIFRYDQLVEYLSQRILHKELSNTKERAKKEGIFLTNEHSDFNEFIDKIKSAERYIILYSINLSLDVAKEICDTKKLKEDLLVVIVNWNIPNKLTTEANTSIQQELFKLGAVLIHTNKVQHIKGLFIDDQIVTNGGTCNFSKASFLFHKSEFNIKENSNYENFELLTMKLLTMLLLYDLMNEKEKSVTL